LKVSNRASPLKNIDHKVLDELPLSIRREIELASRKYHSVEEFLDFYLIQVDIHVLYSIQGKETVFRV
jgi:hypothetical protein